MENSDATLLLLPFLIPLIFIIVFPLFWSTICFLIGALGGWQKLAQDYATEEDLSGSDTFKMQSGRFGNFTSYKNMLHVAVSLEGILLRTMILFRPGHKPLLIPWEAIQQIEIGKTLFRKATTLTIQPRYTGKKIQLQLYGTDLAESIHRNSPPRFDLKEI